MTKNDLRVGYIAVLRNGAKYMVMPMAGDDGEKMVFSNLNDINSYKSFSKYDNDLTNIKNSKYDVVKVYGLSSRISGLSIDTDDRELLLTGTATAPTILKMTIFLTKISSMTILTMIPTIAITTITSKITVKKIVSTRYLPQTIIQQPMIIL